MLRRRTIEQQRCQTARHRPNSMRQSLQTSNFRFELTYSIESNQLSAKIIRYLTTGISRNDSPFGYSARTNDFPPLNHWLHEF